MDYFIFYTCTMDSMLIKCLELCKSDNSNISNQRTIRKPLPDFSSVHFDPEQSFAAKFKHSVVNMQQSCQIISR